MVTTLLILVVVGIAASLIAQFWTEVLWFDSVNFRRVFLTELGAKVLLGVVGGLLTAAIVGSSLYIAYRTRPIYAPTSTNRAPTSISLRASKQPWPKRWPTS